MGNNYPFVRFEEILSEPLLNGLFRPKKVRGEGIKMVNMGELFSYDRIKSPEMERVPLSGSESRYLLKSGDLLFARQSLVRSGAGKCSIFLGSDEPTTFEGHIIRARLNKDKADPLYFYYFFNSYVGKSTIQTIVEQVAAAGIRQSDLQRLQIPLPPPHEQKRISTIFGTLDDKIELNQRMNETLEAIARAIFKSWFVDFDPVRAKMAGEPYPLPDAIMALFPDELVESELGMIPKGWEVVKLKEFGKIVTGKTPSTKKPSYYDSKDIPFIKIPDMHDQLFITSTNNFLSIKGAESQSNKYLPGYSICVSCIATPGLVSMTTELSQTNQQINSIIPDDDKMAYYLLLTMANKGEQIRKYGSGGSVVNNLNKTDFSKLVILAPDDKVVQSFNKRIRKIFKKIINNQQEFSILRILWDTMLSYYFN